MNARGRGALALGIAALGASAGGRAVVATAATAPAAPPALRVTIEPPQATVGDLLRLRFEAPSLPAGTVLSWSEPAARWGEAEVVEGQVAAAGDGRATAPALDIVLRAFTPGAIALAPRGITARGPGGFAASLRTPEGLALPVVSVLPQEGEGGAGEEPQPAPAMPPRPLPLGDAFVWTQALAAAAAIAALAAYALARRRGDGALESARPALAPWVEFEAALRALAKQPAAAAERHQGLHAALRRYLGRRLAFPALESTTAEVQRALRQRDLEALRASTVVRLLREIDQIKFARREATPAAFVERLEAAARVGREIEDEIERRSAPATPANAAAQARGGGS